MSRRKANDVNAWATIIQEYENNYGSGEGPPGEDVFEVELMTPKQIVEELNRTVIGQDKAKELVAIAAWNRLLSMKNKELERDDDYYFEKNNILLVGNTGCGKTHLIKALAEAVSLPVTIQDATGFTSAGYVGRDVDECIIDLFENARTLVEKNYDTLYMSRYDKSDLIKKIAEYGIIYVDEADKIRTSNSNGKDVNGRSVQEAFLKLVEGTECTIKSVTYCGTVDTSNMLFIFGGAFSGLDQIISKRLDGKSIGFSAPLLSKAEKSNLLNKASISDFTANGMIPELMGRLPIIAVLKNLDRDMIYKIFTLPERCIMSQVVNEFKSYGVEAYFTEDAVNHIVDQALELKLGARGLKSVCQQSLRPLLFHLPSNELDRPLMITKKLLLTIGEDE